MIRSRSQAHRSWGWSGAALLAALVLGACQPPLPATACTGDPDCPPPSRCAVEYAVCVLEDAAVPVDAATGDAAR